MTNKLDLAVAATKRAPDLIPKSVLRAKAEKYDMLNSVVLIRTAEKGLYKDGKPTDEMLASTPIDELAIIQQAVERAGRRR